MPESWRTLTAMVHGSGGTTSDHARNSRFSNEQWRATVWSHEAVARDADGVVTEPTCIWRLGYRCAVIDRAVLVQRASKSARRLRILNVATLCTAVAVYVGLVVVAMFEDVAPLILFSSCIMLAELLVFQIVRTLSDHLDLMR